jgi:hypothetical protein
MEEEEEDVRNCWMTLRKTGSYGSYGMWEH